jgi:hypothetical protein
MWEVNSTDLNISTVSLDSTNWLVFVMQILSCEIKNQSNFKTHSDHLSVRTAKSHLEN